MIAFCAAASECEASMSQQIYSLVVLLLFIIFSLSPSLFVCEKTAHTKTNNNKKQKIIIKTTKKRERTNRPSSVTLYGEHTIGSVTSPTLHSFPTFFDWNPCSAAIKRPKSQKPSKRFASKLFVQWAAHSQPKSGQQQLEVV